MSVGIGTFLGGIGKIIDLLPIQGRKERWKNEIDTITKEKSKLISVPATEKSAKRVAWIIERTAYLNQLLKNSAGD
jgi:hypothetical protein